MPPDFLQRLSSPNFKQVYSGLPGPALSVSIAIEDEGVPKGTVLTINFVGSGVTASVTGSEATIDIPGGIGSVSWGDILGTVSDQADLVSYIAAQIAALVNSAPGALDTLKELADALGDDANFAATMTTALAGKASKSLTVETVTGTTYTFLAADSGKHKRFTNGSAIAATVNHGVHSVGDRIRITVAGAGQLTLIAAANVQLNSRAAALKSAGQFAVLELECVATGATDEFDVLGDVTA